MHRFDKRRSWLWPQTPPYARSIPALRRAYAKSPSPAGSAKHWPWGRWLDYRASLMYTIAYIGMQMEPTMPKLSHPLASSGPALPDLLYPSHEPLRLSPLAACAVLSAGLVAAARQFLPLSAHLFSLRAGSAGETRRGERWLSGDQAHLLLPSAGRVGLRSGTAAQWRRRTRNLTSGGAKATDYNLSKIPAPDLFRIVYEAVVRHTNRRGIHDQLCFHRPVLCWIANPWVCPQQRRYAPQSGLHRKLARAFRGHPLPHPIRA